MPEEDRQVVRVRIGLERGIAGRFARMAEQYGVRESWLVEQACWLGLPELEARMERRIALEYVGRRQLDEVVGPGGQTAAESTDATKSPASPQPAGGVGSPGERLGGKLTVNEERPQYSVAPRQPARSPDHQRIETRGKAKGHR